jgi:beta-galactosidase
VIAVRVSNTGRNSRWYSGSGIYRNVHLTLVNPVHIAVWGVQVTTPEISGESASVSLAIKARNDGSESVEALVTTRVTGPDNQPAGETSSKILLPPRENSELQQMVSLRTPSLWSPDSPNLYQAEITLSVKGKITDRLIQPFGIRSITVSAEKGFLLNGEPLELKGGCLHHDNGLLGAAAFERAEERRVEIMKANGFNAIRTSHNPPSEAFLNTCDRQGMLVIDETFDMWERPKNPQDYHRFFREWWKSDVEAMILRDRNHPSIIFWSIGNEVNERADTSGLRIARQLIAHIQQFDTTRPFTNAICEFWDMPGRPWEATAPAFSLLTAGGYNYQYLRYEEDHAKYPDRVMMGTESVPMDAFGNWQMVEKHPWVIGDFVWTGMDYLGESGIGHTQYLEPGQPDAFAMPWPWFNAWCGDIDLLGNKKPQMLYRDVLWGNSQLEINVHAPVPAGKTEKISYWGWYDEWPSWDWLGHEDKILRVSAYTPGTSVRLELNGRVIGEKEVSAATRFTAVFDVPYEPGELRAIALEGDRELAVKVLRTAGTPLAIRLTADRNSIRADRNDLAFVTLEIVDEFGQPVTDAARQVTISVTGNGELVGSGNACPYDMKSFGKPELTTFRGKAMVIVRPYSNPGVITITAAGEGLKETTIDVKTER